MKQTLSSFFSKNRLEEIKNKDLWGEYVLPLNYQNLLHLTKSSHITGGRGSGKTAYVQYHCYPTILSKRKKEIKADELKDIGIYWRPDDDMLPDMTYDVLGKNWINAFNAYFGISILIELSKFLKTFITSPFDDDTAKENVKELTLPTKLLKSFNIEKEIKFIDFAEEGHYLRSELIEWLCFPTEKSPFLFKAKDKIEHFIRIIQSIEVFKDTKFHIFVDEFENLSTEQQRQINSWMKFVGENIIVNVAYKAHYTPEEVTIANETLQDVHDYRVINLEKDLYGDTFELVTSEIILNQLQEFFNEPYSELKNYGDNYLSDINSIDIRKDEIYKTKVKTLINTIFPSYKLLDIANIMINDSLLFKKINTEIKKALENKNEKKLTYSDFIDDSKPQETILNAILLNRTKAIPMDIQKMFLEDKAKYVHWKDINLLGAILFFYNKEKHNRICPYYGGFGRFVLQSSFNTRHLIELVRHSFYKLEQTTKLKTIYDVILPIEIQAEAARIVSTYEFDRKISFLGKHGTKLKVITERLGKLFALIQNNPAQSFAEVVHFSILFGSKDSHNVNVTEENNINSFLSELKMWSVIVEYDNSKILNKQNNNSLKEYRLHPILSSYFGISPRKKRKIDLSLEDVKIIFFGTEEEYTSLYNRYSPKQVNEDNIPKFIQKTFSELF